jgi:DNA-binding CsgD family transcriptional regulator
MRYNKKRTAAWGFSALGYDPTPEAVSGIGMPKASKCPQGIAVLNRCPCPEVELRIVEFAYFIGLSLREGAVLLLVVGGGIERKAAAYGLQCRPGTIDTYWRRILRKSGHESPLQLIAALLAFAVSRPARWRADLSRIVPGGADEADFQRYRRAVHAEICGFRKN